MMDLGTIEKIAHKKKRAKKINEILDILQEECAEVIQAISKCRRFGIDEIHIKSGQTQREQLVQEIGDVTLLIELLHSYQLFTQQELRTAERNKANKLTKWSTIYEV
jgi:NTP pyrophosphatase (non-canonical NTP hydrolase)